MLLIVLGLLALVVAFVVSVKRMPGATPAEKKTAVVTFMPTA
jgi:hypothetical protein